MKQTVAIAEKFHSEWLDHGGQKDLSFAALVEQKTKDLHNIPFAGWSRD